MIRSSTVLVLGRASPAIGRQASFASTMAAVKSSEPESVRPFEEMPGPKALPIVGNLWRFVPVIGEFSSVDPTNLYNYLRKKYGPIIKVDGLITRNPLVFVVDPELSAKVYRFEGPYPERHGLACVTYYRQVVMKDYYEGVGDALTQHGETWYNFRSKVNSTMIHPENVKMYAGHIDVVAGEMIERMRGLRDEKGQLPDDFMNYVYKWSFESIGFIAMDTRFGSLDPNRPPDSNTQLLIDTLHSVFDTVYLLEFRPPLWKLVSTPTWRRFSNGMDIIFREAEKRVEAAKEQIMSRKLGEKENMSVLETLLLKHADSRIATVMAIDMVLTGIDTTSHAAAFLLYYLATNQDKQEKLYEEVKSVLPESKTQPITAQSYEEMKYLKACMKESFRIQAVSPGSLRRILKDDFVLGGYSVPKGTDVMMCHLEMCKMEENFPNALQFIPERWLKGDDDSVPARKAHLFAFQPFGFGVRTCLGKRFAMLEIATLTAKVVRNFKIEYDSPLLVKSTIINTFASPLNLKLTDRAN